MKIQYKYIHFVQTDTKPKTSVWACRNRKSNMQLGMVRWHPGWRQYCFFPEPFVEAIYSAGCLRDIADFIAELGKHGKETP